MKTFIFLSSNGEVCHMLLAHAVKLAKRSDRRANVLVVFFTHGLHVPVLPVLASSACHVHDYMY